LERVKCGRFTAEELSTFKKQANKDIESAMAKIEYISE
jgi:hypothetical protein